MMNMCAVAGLRSASMFGTWCAAFSIFDSAEASHIGWPAMRAPRSSAAYSRVRLIAICTSMAAKRRQDHHQRCEPMMPGPWLLSRLPPKNMPNCATIEIAPAMVAVMVISSVS